MKKKSPKFCPKFLVLYASIYGRPVKLAPQIHLFRCLFGPVPGLFIFSCWVFLLGNRTVFLTTKKVDNWPFNKKKKLDFHFFFRNRLRNEFSRVCDVNCVKCGPPLSPRFNKLNWPGKMGLSDWVWAPKSFIAILPIYAMEGSDFVRNHQISLS